jgi:replicative superfamily II helicase
METSTIVFVHSRKETCATAQPFSECSPGNGQEHIFVSSTESQRTLSQRAAEVSNTERSSILLQGFAFHHAWPAMDGGHTAEELFRSRPVKPLAPPAMLAWGSSGQTVIIEGPRA